MIGMGARHREEAALVLADGATFEGEGIGVSPEGGLTTGEAVFTTVLSGYQEVITDPSYAGQVVAFTYPQIGNYGANPGDNEATVPHCRGVIVRDLCDRPSNWRSEETLEQFLIRNNVPGITGVDTRRLTRHLRELGSMPCAFGTASLADLRGAAEAAPTTSGVDLVLGVTTSEPYTRGQGPYRVVAYDFGIKEAMLRQLGEIATVTVVPASTTAADSLALEPDGIFLSNGPGDPADQPGAIAEIRALLDDGSVPIFGICLGHQLLASALGGTTYKLLFGHHGGNHPVQQVGTERVEITSQNHNFAVAEDSLTDVEVTHRNLNDGVVEGFRCVELPAFGVQYHPEAGPGPHDARYLFEEFRRLMDATGAIAGSKGGNH
jgi:carbamoyl-phosphate synthase small subunit